MLDVTKRSIIIYNFTSFKYEGLYAQQYTRHLISPAISYLTPCQGKVEAEIELLTAEERKLSRGQLVKVETLLSL